MSRATPSIRSPKIPPMPEIPPLVPVTGVTVIGDHSLRLLFEDGDRRRRHLRRREVDRRVRAPPRPSPFCQSQGRERDHRFARRRPRHGPRAALPGRTRASAGSSERASLIRAQFNVLDPIGFETPRFAGRSPKMPEDVPPRSRPHPRAARHPRKRPANRRVRVRNVLRSAPSAWSACLSMAVSVAGAWLGL